MGGSAPVEAACGGRGQSASFRLSFGSRPSGAETILEVNCAAGWRFSGALSPGVYDVWFEAGEKSGVTTGRVLVQQGLEVMDAPLELLLDVPLTHVSGRLVENGQPMKNGECILQTDLATYWYSYLRIKEEQSGREDLFVVRCTDGWRYEGYLRPGRYRATLERSLPYPGHNDYWTEPSSFHVPEGVFVQDLNLPTRPLEVALRRDGREIVDTTCQRSWPPPGSNPFTRLLFRDLSTGLAVEVIVDCRGGRPWHAIGAVQPGVYEVKLLALSDNEENRGTFCLADALEVR
jgi:hypothetical protein